MEDHKLRTIVIFMQRTMFDSIIFRFQQGVPLAHRLEIKNVLFFMFSLL